MEAHLYRCSGHIQSGHRLRSSHSVKNSEFGGIANYGAGLPEWRQKNEKDWPPIHSCEQSFQIILLNERGLFCDLTFPLIVLPEELNCKRENLKEERSYKLNTLCPILPSESVYVIDLL